VIPLRWEWNSLLVIEDKKTMYLRQCLPNVLWKSRLVQNPGEEAPWWGRLTEFEGIGAKQGGRRTFGFKTRALNGL
jgi:hypothetical protein